MGRSDAEYVDPQMAVILAAMRERSRSRPAITQIPIAEARARARADFAHWNADPPPVRRVCDLAVEGAFGETRVRLYDPVEADGTRPALVYFHGGGWMIGDLDLEDSALRTLARESGVPVFSVDYVLAPEHRFPRPLEDCLCASRALRSRAAEWRIDPDRLALGGASAGANLALSTALTLRDAGEPWPRFLLLMYGVYSADHGSASHRRYGAGDYGLETASMEFFWSQYLEDGSERLDPRAAPLHARLDGLPPTFVMGAGLDPLRDDTERLAGRLEQSGVPTELRIYPGVVHGFTLMGRSLEAANAALRDAGAALRSRLA